MLDETGSKISFPRFGGFVLCVLASLPSVFVVIGLLFPLLLYPPPIPYGLEASIFTPELFLEILLKLWKPSHQELAKEWILHLGTCKIEKHSGTAIIWTWKLALIRKEKSRILSNFKSNPFFSIVIAACVRNIYRAREMGEGDYEERETISESMELRFESGKKKKEWNKAHKLRIEKPATCLTCLHVSFFKGINLWTWTKGWLVDLVR